MGILTFGEFMIESTTYGLETAGVVFLYQNKILLVHPTNASWKKGLCSIPKGKVEPGEDVLTAALREVREETGIILTPDQLELSPEVVTFYAGGKIKQLTYFICNLEDLSEIGLSSLTVPKSQLQLEEVDWAKFVTAEEAYPLISRSQLIIIDRHLTLNK